MKQKPATIQSNTIQSKNSVLLPAEHPDKIRHWKFRVFKDKLARHSITLGGNSVIVAILLILFYLIYETAPLLKGADITMIAEYPVISNKSGIKKNAQTEISTRSYYTVEEQGEVAAKCCIAINRFN